jgi:HlyD family secretion protein
VWQVASIGPAPLDDGLYPVEVTLTRPAANLREGMLLTASFLAPAATKAIQIPVDAVVERDGRSYVFIVGSDSRLALREVQLGSADLAKVTVASGLRDGDHIVREGGDFLRDGDTVRVTD